MEEMSPILKKDYLKLRLYKQNDISFYPYASPSAAFTQQKGSNLNQSEEFSYNQESCASIFIILVFFVSPLPKYICCLSDRLCKALDFNFFFFLSNFFEIF